MEPTTPQNNKQENKGDSISPLRTYERDVAEFVERGNVSLTNIAMAEQARRSKTGERNVASPAATIGGRNKIIIIIGSFLLLVGIGFFVYFAINKKSPEAPKAKEPKRQIISAEFSKDINIGGLSERDLLALLIKERKESNVSPTLMLRLRLTTGENELRREASTEEFLTALKTSTPSSLIRALSPDLVFGLHSLTSIEPFLILKVIDYDNAFSGMLAWEKSLVNDLGAIFIAQSGADNNLTRLSEKSFEDKVIRNKDTRVLKKDNGQPALLYSFPDRETLIITTNENTFQEVSERLRTAKLIR